MFQRFLLVLLLPLTHALNLTIAYACDDVCFIQFINNRLIDRFVSDLVLPVISSRRLQVGMCQECEQSTRHQVIMSLHLWCVMPQVQACWLLISMLKGALSVTPVGQDGRAPILLQQRDGILDIIIMMQHGLI